MKLKKALALLMSGCMIVGLMAGCSSSSSDAGTSSDAQTTQAADSQDSSDTTTTTEDTSSGDSGFVWNGQKEVWSILPTTGAEGLVQINDAMGAVMESYGFTYVKKDAEGTPGNQVQFVEQAIAAGNVGALMIAAMSVEMLKDVVEQATEAGIAVAYLGAQPTDYTIAGCVYTAYEITGMYAVQAAEYWVQTSGANVPTDANGKYQIAIDTYYDIADGVYRSNAIKGTVESSDILSLVSETQSYGDNALTTAYNNAQTVLNANPDCHLFIAYEPEEAMGIANAIADYCDQTGGSLADYCVIPCYSEDTTFSEMYAAVEADASANAIKGYATYGDPVLSLADAEAQLGEYYAPLLTFAQSIDPDTEVLIPTLLTGEHLAEILLGVCGVGDHSWTYGETYYDTITAVTVDGFSATWSMGEDNPAAQYKN